MLTALALISLLSLFASLYFLAQEKQKSSLTRGQLDRAENEINFLRGEKEKELLQLSENLMNKNNEQQNIFSEN